ncbi:MAG: hypothetical protein U0694_16000 [Anaerolineae bacterium]
MKDPQNKQPGGMQIIIGVVVVLVILFIASRFLGGSQASETPAPTSQPDNQQVEQNNSDSGLNLGSVVVAENVDRDGCAVDVTDRFDDNATVYAVLGDSAMPEGTRVFARLYRDDVAVEDRDEITADQDYTNVCVSFSFVPDQPWESGDYEVEIFVNGNAYESASFTVR